MARAVWSEDARSDLREILGYIAKRNPDASEVMRALLESAAERLAEFPSTGRPGRLPDTREAVVHPNYILVYREETTRIRIVNILHSARQYPPE